MYNIELCQLEKICDQLITSRYPYYEELREAFKLLKHTGCRIQEIFEIERWTQVEGWEFTLTPQKGNNDRTIILNSEFEEFYKAVVDQYPPFMHRRYSQLQNLFDQICSYRPIFSGDKPISLYVFRYFFIWDLNDQGYTNQQIADITGHTTTSVIDSYVNANLVCPYDIKCCS
jgi:site-specific recombinase XerD